MYLKNPKTKPKIAKWQQQQQKQQIKANKQKIPPNQHLFKWIVFLMQKHGLWRVCILSSFWPVWNLTEFGKSCFLSWIILGYELEGFSRSLQFNTLFKLGKAELEKKFRSNSFKFSLVGSVIFLASLKSPLRLQTPQPWRPSHSKSSWEVRTGWICSNSSQVLLKSVLHGPDMPRSPGSCMAHVLCSCTYVLASGCTGNCFITLS